VKRLAAYGEPVEGTPFGRYRLIELLGRGGMGEVWRAHDTSTNRIVAIKLLPPHLAQDDTFVKRFRREAEAAARLNSPHIIPIHDYGEIDGRLYVNMRLIEGRDLQQVLADGPMEPARAVRIIEEVAKALHAAHKVGLIHRDVKPSNILLDEDDFAYLIDFGLARAAGETRLTSAGFIGSWHYMAPERFGAQEADARADVYALACVLYECLTGHTPYPGDSLEQQYDGHKHTPSPQPSSTNPDLPADFDRVTEKGMAKDPDERYATTVELANAAHDAITVPIKRPAPAPTLLPTTQQADNLVPAQPMTVKAESPASAKPGPPPRPAPPTPARAGGISRGTIALIVGAIALVVVIVAAVGLAAFGNHRVSSPTSSSPPTSSARSYAAQTALPFTGLKDPCGVAVDTAGNVYVVDGGSGADANNQVLELPAGSSTQTVLPFTGLKDPYGVAVDTVGTVYVADYGNNRVVKLAATGARVDLPLTGEPFGVAVDTAGNLYVADNTNGTVLVFAAGSGTQTVLPITGLGATWFVAVDTAGAVYVTGERSRGVVKLAAGSSAQAELPFTDLNQQHLGVAVDTAGNVYVVDTGNNRVLELPAGSSTQTVLAFTGLKNPCGVAVDTTGNLYVADRGNNRVVKLPAG
jgi:serine/threonine-protein kinase